MAIDLETLKVKIEADDKKFSDGLKRVNESMNRASDNFKAKAALMATTFRGVGGAVTAVIAAVTAAALGVKSFIDHVGDLDDAAQAAGLTAEQFQVMTQAAKLSGLQVGEFEAGMNRLRIAIDDAREDSLSPAAQEFAKLGISLTDATGKAKTNQQIFNELSEAVQQGANVSGIFGRASAKWIQLLAKGSKNIQQVNADLREQNAIISNESVEAIAHAGDELDAFFGGVAGQLTVATAELLKFLGLIGRSDMERLNLVNKKLNALEAGGNLGIAEVSRQRNINNLYRQRQQLIARIGSQAAPTSNVPFPYVNTKKLKKTTAEAFDTSRAMADIGKNAEQTNRLAKDLGLTFSSAFEEAIAHGERLRGVLAGLAQDIQRIVLRNTVTEPLGQLLTGAIGGFLGGGGLSGDAISAKVSGSALQSVIPTLGGSSTSASSFINPSSFFPGRATGGPVSMGKPYIVGERGPELFVPSSAGNVVANNRMGGPSVVVNISASDAASFRANSAQIGAQIAAAVQRGNRVR